MSNKPYITLSVICKTEVYALTTASINGLITCENLVNNYGIRQSLCIGQSDLPKARSSELTRWYEIAKEQDIFMFIDADQVFKADDILLSLKLLETYPVVCGAYARKGGNMTVEPKDQFNFRKNKQGELYYGATGMMMIRYDIVKKMVDHLGPQIFTSNISLAYPFFYERIVREPDEPDKDLWLGEDYSFCWLTRQLGGIVYGYVSPTVGHILSLEQFINISDDKIWPDNSIVYFCGHTNEKWSGRNITKGIGGSETAIIRLSEYWSNKGYDVTVYCNCEENENYNNVRYRQYKEFNFSDLFNILIIWRQTIIPENYVLRAKKRFLDLHDIINPNSITKNVLRNIDNIMVKSQYHRSLIPDIKDDKVIVIPNGGAITSFVNEVERDPNYLIYTSSYDRGLYFMLKWGWPKIKKAIPDAYLKVFYGWNGFDIVYQNNDNGQHFKSVMLDLLKQDGVEECGRISCDELMVERRKANIHYYMGDFNEIDCISVRESACAGAIPVVSKNVPVFNEKSYCIEIEGKPQTQECQENAAEYIIALMRDNDLADEYREKLPEKVMNETWENIAEKWIEFFN